MVVSIVSCLGIETLVIVDCPTHVHGFIDRRRPALDNNDNNQ